ncbi:hypothetical protein EHN06_20060 [Marinobacter sp. NP-4(2019)]|uniref:type I restriction enzyme HsdR N-terminal domain-containing protein n=1 Tax=Marinobacter sp. NP-4(2019) TaxID=2488665 RepID=UPI000FC3DD54|nr:type I restriction enzyme HsdR N-terminal domain-containing protein [Marinobacter sp. NP-4(2019)]AZT85660.1 hypothetical protein EHN06_20060 [Marinobacter sp. NP-4(2019)]
MRELEVQKALRQELTELGYPESAVHLEFPVSVDRHKRISIDVAIIDQGTNDVIGIIEIKSSTESQSVSNAVQQLADYARLLPSSPPAFVYAYDGKEKRIFQVSGDTLSLEEIPSLPKFDSLKAGGRAYQKIESRKKSSRVTDSFAVYCRLLAFFVAAILVLDIASVYKFTSQQLTLLGIFIGLLVMPYAAKFKLMGMEFERYGGKKNEDS